VSGFVKVRIPPVEANVRVDAIGSPYVDPDTLESGSRPEWKMDSVLRITSEDGQIVVEFRSRGGADALIDLSDRIRQAVYGYRNTLVERL
jgi:hypothetical protein